MLRSPRTCEFGPHLPGERIRGRIEMPRRNRAEIHGLGPLRSGWLHDHHADAAEAAVPWFDRHEGKGGGDDRVDGGPARRQHLGTDLRRSGVLRGDDTAMRGRARLADRPVLGRMHLDGSVQLSSIESTRLV
jgi:hypothetical protein